MAGFNYGLGLLSDTEKQVAHDENLVTE